MAKCRLFTTWIAGLCLAALCCSDAAWANGSLFAGGGALTRVRHSDTGVAATRNRASLFLAAPNAGLFADRPVRAGRHTSRLKVRPRQLDRLRQLIEHAESRRDGYDAVQYGARIKPTKSPTRMTLREVYAWIDATPGQPHAIGRYQFIPVTLRRLASHLGLSPDTPFSAAVQDRMADILLAEAGLNRFTKGEIARDELMLGLAKIWAGLPTANGRSYYHGHAGNKAHISWASFEQEMARIFPG